MVNSAPIKDPTLDNIKQWLKEKVKPICTNCDNTTDFGLSGKFAMVEVVHLKMPAIRDVLTKHIVQRYITVTCKNCGKAEFYDATIAGFTKPLNEMQ